MYRVVLDGEDILNFDDPRLLLLNSMLEMELNTAGSFEFTIPPRHELYEDDDGIPYGLNFFYGPVHPLSSTIEVYEDNTIIWWGRPVEVKQDYYKQIQVYCEGALAFFNDTVQRFHEYDTVSLHRFFRDVIAAHNAQVAEIRQFTVGNLSIEDKTVYRKLNYETTFDVLKRMCLDAEGGYFYLRRENGVNYIDWLPYVQLPTNQPVEFGLNLLDFNANFDATEIATCVIPLGKEDEDTGAPLTIASVNNGSDLLESEAADRYGRITKTVSFSGINDVYELLHAGREYLENTQFNNFSVQCSAADLHGQNENYNSFRLGQLVACRSTPHLLRRQYPITKISVRLDSPNKQITLGTTPKRTLTRIQKEERDEIRSVRDGDEYDSGGGGSGTASESPYIVGITISSAPKKRLYAPGETLDYDGLRIVANLSNGKTSIITGDCAIAPNHGAAVTETGTLTVSVQYTGLNASGTEQTFTASFDLNVQPQFSDVIVMQHPAKETFAYGEALDYTGLQIIAYLENGEELDITADCEYSPESGSVPETSGFVSVSANYFGRNIPSLFQVTVLPPNNQNSLISQVVENTSYIAGYVAGQQFKKWRGDPSILRGGVSFYDWAGASDPMSILADPEQYAQYAAGLDNRFTLGDGNTLLWKPTVDDLTGIARFQFGRYEAGGWSDRDPIVGYVDVNAAGHWSGSARYPSTGTVLADCTVTLNEDRRSWHVVYRGSADDGEPNGLAYFHLNPAIDGTYRANGTTSRVGVGHRANGTAVNISGNWSDVGDSLTLFTNQTYRIGWYGKAGPGSSPYMYGNSSASWTTEYDNLRGGFTTASIISAEYDSHLPAFQVIPHTSNGLELAPRPGTLAGSPLNETARTFANPITGETVEFDSFTYDPQTRTYTLALSGGGGMEVQFSDNFMTIKNTSEAGETSGDIAFYPDMTDADFLALPDTAFNKEAYLAGFAAGMAS